MKQADIGEEQTRPHRRTVSLPPEALSGTFAEVYPRLPQKLQRELDLSGIICSFVNHADTALQVTSRVEYSIVIQRALEIGTVHHIEELRAKLGG